MKKRLDTSFNPAVGARGIFPVMLPCFTATPEILRRPIFRFEASGAVMTQPAAG